MNIIISLKLWRYWLYRANLNYKLKYRKSILGLLWPMLSLVILTGIIGFVWGELLDKDNRTQYYLYILSGYPVWGIVSGSIEQGCRPFRPQIDGVPFFATVLERAAIVFIPFIYVLPLIVVASLVFHEYQPVHFIYFPATFIVLMFWVVGAISIIITLTSWLSDLEHLISATMRLAFLATPIIWEVERLGEYQLFVWYNPFYMPLEGLRSSLSGLYDSQASLYVLFFCYGLGVLLLGVFLLRFRK